MVDITMFVVAVIIIISFTLTYLVIPYIKAKTDEQTFKVLCGWADVAVAAAQQLFYHLDGPDRKKEALKFLQNLGYDVNTEKVDKAIEAAVLKLHSKPSE